MTTAYCASRSRAEKGPRTFSVESLLRALFVAVAFLGIIGFAGAASAQTVTVPAAGFVINRPGKDPEFPRVANRADCLDSDRSKDKWTYFELQPKFTGLTSGTPTFEIWVGKANCTELTNRQPSSGSDQCARVYQRNAIEVSESGQAVTLSVRDVAYAVTHLQGEDADGEVGFGTIDDCDADLDQFSLGFYFMITDGSNTVKGTPDATNGVDRFIMDFEGPSAPDAPDATPGDQYIFLDWTFPNTTDLRGFRFYCDPAGGTPPVTGNGGAGGAGGATSGATGSCTSDSLVPGELVAAGLVDCGGINGQIGAGSGRTDKLTNNVEYAVAITAFDKYGNESELSDLSCATPQEVTTFYESYRAAGGKGGGGFCSWDPRRGESRTTLVLLTLGALALVSRRVRTRA